MFCSFEIGKIKTDEVIFLEIVLTLIIITDYNGLRPPIKVIHRPTEVKCHIGFYDRNSPCLEYGLCYILFTLKTTDLHFLAVRRPTNGRAYDTGLCPSVSQSVCPSITCYTYCG